MRVAVREVANERREFARTRDRSEMTGPLEDDTARAADQRHVAGRAVHRHDVIERALAGDDKGRER